MAIIARALAHGAPINISVFAARTRPRRMAAFASTRRRERHGDGGMSSSEAAPSKVIVHVM